jgi:HTH-type transcriptional regulator/antitoxin HigA
MKTWKVIKTEEEYDRANERVEFLMEIEPLNNTPEGDELDLLFVLIKNYDDENYPIPELDPIEVIKFFMKEKGLVRKDLENVIGDKTLVSRVLNKKRKLSLEMIRRLVEKLSIPIDLLVKDYQLNL